MPAYLNEWRDETTITWVKSHAEDGGVVTNDHGKPNRRADEDAEGACQHPDTPLYRK